MRSSERGRGHSRGGGRQQYRGNGRSHSEAHTQYRGGGRGSGQQPQFSGRGGRGRTTGSESDRSHKFISYPASQQFAIIRKSDIPPGIQGRSVELLANFFQITVQPVVAYHYDLEFAFKNEEDKTRIESEKLQKYFANAAPTIFEKFVEVNKKYFENIRFIYDTRKNLYCVKTLDLDNMIKTVEAKVSGREKQFQVELKMVEKIDLSLLSGYYNAQTSDVPEVVVHLLELLFQNVNKTHFSLHQRKFFDATPSNLLCGSKDWIQFSQGFSDSIRLTEIGPTLNLHLRTSCIISSSVDSLLQLVRMICNGADPSSLNEGHFSKVNKIIRGLKIYTTHTGRKATYTIKTMLSQTPKESVFMIKREDEEVQTTVNDYFLEKYKIQVKDYPVINVMGKNHLLPLELCLMVEKQFLNNSKIDTDIQKDLLHVSTYKPFVYFNNLCRYANEIRTLKPQLMSEFRTDFTPKPVRFYGRILNAPRQKCGNRTDVFFKVPPKPKWAFFSFDRNFNDQDIRAFISDLKNIGRRYNFDFSDCIRYQLVEIRFNDPQQVSSFFSNVRRRIPDLSAIYNMIKHCGDQKYGIVTQCVNVDKAKNRGRGYIDNILLKVNGKLGGQNSVIEELDFKQFPFNNAKTMVIGVDVNHPGQTEKVESSIAAAVGSYDSQFTLFSASIRVQKKNRDEIINCLEEMIDELLNEYRKVNGYFPENLVVFRDGVSDGQFKHAENEIKQIHSSFRKKVKNGKVIFIVVQKGHQTRFVLAKPSGSQDRIVYNVPSGTIVDNTIVEPSHHMFYLNSHFSPLGTSRPMKYVILNNDFDPKVLSNDALQQFCFYLCHNCTRFRGGPIAMPIPIRYADLCAYRSKAHVEAQHELITISEDQQQSFEQLVILKLNTLIKMNESMKKYLYYC